MFSSRHWQESTRKIWITSLGEEKGLTRDQKCSAIFVLCMKMAEFHNSLRRDFTEKAYRRPLGSRKTATVLCFAKGSKTFYAALHLYEGHFHEDTAILARSLVNIAINVRYFRSAPNDELAERFLRYEAIERERMAERWGLPLTLEQKQETEVAAKEARALFNYGPEGKGWSGIPIEQMAKSFPKEMYQMFYRYLSGFEHSSPVSLRSFIAEDADGRIRIADEPDSQGRHRDIIYALFTFAAYLTTELVQECIPDRETDLGNLNSEFQRIMRPTDGTAA